MISFYNKYVGGVDLPDYLASIYAFDRKSTKWWKKVFYKMLMTTAVNSYIIYYELKRKIIVFSDYLLFLAERLIEISKSNANLKKILNFWKTFKTAKDNAKYWRPYVNS